MNHYRNLPRVDDVLGLDEIKACLGKYDRQHILEVIRTEIDKEREAIRSGGGEYSFSLDVLIARILSEIQESERRSLVSVINATGIILHTNMGRALLSKSAAKKVYDISTGYNNLELDLATGKRGKRDTHLAKLLCRLTGAEDAMVVNNNAAAVMLILTALAKDKETIVSRGELVEIGGSFRIPDVMRLSGSRLVEVGTTNRTHLHDYENAITEDTAVLLKVHTSNYEINGFTSSVGASELGVLADDKDIVVVEDLGSGNVFDLSMYGVKAEDVIREKIDKGIDLICFSGDKLLGGPQAGIIVGRKPLVEKLRKHQLARALRVGKMTIAALEETIFEYVTGKPFENIPLLGMLSVTENELLTKAETLLSMISAKGSIKKTKAYVGGGTYPSNEIEGYSVFIDDERVSSSELKEKLRFLERPIIARIENDSVILDVRTIDEKDISYVASSINGIFGGDNE